MNNLPDANCQDPLKSIRDFKVNHPKNLILCHYNINSIRNKFSEASLLLMDQLVDILAIGETKIDDSFPNEQFYVQNYRLHRQDRNGRGGGIMLYVNDSIPHRIVKEHTGITKDIEHMTIEISMKSKKWYLIYIYRPPKVLVSTFRNFMNKMCDNFVNDCNVSVFLGDMNCNMKETNELTDICDLYGLTSLVKEPTCFKSSDATIVDVILTNKPRSFLDTFNSDIGLSDFHNCIGVASKMFAPVVMKRRVNYRSMKTFDDKSFCTDVSTIPFDICNVFDDIDDVSWAQNYLLMSVINEHAPVKTKYISGNQVPYMNSVRL